MPRKILVVYYDPSWVKDFAREAEKLSQILGDQLVSMHHIGSTAIPGMYAKPIIDILAETGDISRIDALNADFREAGYQPHGENGVHHRRFFTRDTNGARSHHLHVHQTGDPHIQDHLNFRDYLKAHPQAAQSYASLKRMLARRYPEKIGSYIDGKIAFIEKTFEEARQWQNRKRSK